MGCVKIFCGGRAVASHSGDLGIKRCSNELTEAAHGEFALEVTMSVARAVAPKNNPVALPARHRLQSSLECWRQTAREPPTQRAIPHRRLHRGPTDIGRKCPLEALVFANSPKNAKPNLSWKHLVAPSSHETHPSSN